MVDSMLQTVTDQATITQYNACTAPAQNCPIVSKKIHAQHAKKSKAEDKEYNHCKMRYVIPSHPFNTIAV